MNSYNMTDFLATQACALNAAIPISEIIFNFVVRNVLMGHLSYSLFLFIFLFCCCQVLKTHYARMNY